jgi:hypothetical protein
MRPVGTRPSLVTVFRTLRVFMFFMRLPVVLAFALSSVLFATVANAQVPTIQAVRLEPDERIRLDGVLDEEIWTRAPAATEFRHITEQPVAGRERNVTIYHVQWSLAEANAGDITTAAHVATDVLPAVAGLKSGRTTDRLAQVYDLVARRFLAVFHPDAVYERTRVETTVAMELAAS